MKKEWWWSITQSDRKEGLTMRRELTGWIRQQLMEEQESNGGEYILVTTEDGKTIECSINCSEDVLMSVVDHLVAHISADGILKMAIQTIERINNNEEIN